ncbi:cation:proton antiporter [Filifactor villosus]|uniref:Cation:proton antiporter n=1 Tax=Filifactor villosus TaxID=29374 RepID=A0ABV9QNW6_9FIRM
MHILYYVAVVLAAGIFVAKITGKLKLPNVTGYLIAGLLIGPSITGLVPRTIVEQLSLFSDVALAFIAYSIGSQINFKHLKKVGIGIVVLTLLEALMAMFLVVLVMFFVFKTSLAFALLIGSIACATAPAATMMVIRQYKAKGVVVDTLLPVVAMDDGVSIMAFGVALTVSKALISGKEIQFTQLVVIPSIEILGALALGAVIAFLFLSIERIIKNESELMNLVIVIIFLGHALATRFHFSSLLACMAIGATISNLREGKISYFSIVDNITMPIFVAFFVISGADLDIFALKASGLIGLAYVLVRVAGKWLGAFTGAKLYHMPKTVQNYLGYTLVPQAGVAIGLSLVAQKALPGDYGNEIRTIILAATVIYEFIGPLITKKALIAAGEITLPSTK